MSYILVYNILNSRHHFLCVRCIFLHCRNSPQILRIFNAGKRWQDGGCSEAPPHASDRRAPAACYILSSCRLWFWLVSARGGFAYPRPTPGNSIFKNFCRVALRKILQSKESALTSKEDSIGGPAGSIALNIWSAWCGFAFGYGGYGLLNSGRIFAHATTARSNLVIDVTGDISRTKTKL